MLPLLFILITIALLASFIGLTTFETRRGVRFFDRERVKLDREIARISFIVEHVDLAAFLKDEVRHFAQRAGHDIVNLSLQSVRAIERLLTRLVRAFRVHEATIVAPRENARAFVKTLTDFKEQLKAPEVPEIR